MATHPQHGYLVLADISGFNRYLTGVELDHANEILADLLDLVVGHLKPILIPSQLEGGAVFAYAPEWRVRRGETLLELFETAYAAFRDRLETIRRRTSCACKACRAVPMLDLKFLAHHGDYAAHRMSGGGEQLIGPDVALIRERMLKDVIREATGWRAYALFTAACLSHLRVDPAALRQHVQTLTRVEHIGEVRAYSLDLQSRYRTAAEARRMFLAAAEADCSIVREIPASPAVVWEWLNDPVKRTQWQIDRVWSAETRPEGRTGPGARNHCEHGSGRVTETILDWRPFEYFTVQLVQSPFATLQTMQLDPLEDGRATRLHIRLKLAMRLPRWMSRRMCELAASKGFRYEQGLTKMAELIAEESAPIAAAA